MSSSTTFLAPVTAMEHRGLEVTRTTVTYLALFSHFIYIGWDKKLRRIVWDLNSSNLVQSI